MYCIKCGVELAESEKKCPLCNTKVYHPDIEIEDVPGPYPEFHSESERVNRAGVLFIITMFFALAFILSFLSTGEQTGSLLGRDLRQAVFCLYMCA